MSLKQKILVAVMGAGLTLCGVASASAAPWQDTHPRRVEVNHRLAHQDMRINRALHEGKITRHQAARLHREDRMMRREERRDAAFHGGHITLREQARLNHQENRVSGQLHREAR
jgi:hypothetical protein